MANGYMIGQGLDYSAQQGDIDRQRRLLLAQMLEAQNMNDVPPVGGVVAKRSPWEALVRGITIGMGAYQGQQLNDQQAALSAQQRADAQPYLDLARAEVDEKRQGLVDRTQARESLKTLGTLLGGGDPRVGMPSLAPTVGNAQALEQRAPAAAPDQGAALARQADAIWQEALRTGNPVLQERALELYKAAKEFREKFNTTLQTQLGPDGKPVSLQVGEWGTVRPISGYKPTPKLTPVSQGDRTTLVDELTTPAGTSFPMNMSPAQKDESQRGWARYNLDAKTAGQAPTIELRKEFNALPQVKAWGEVQPVAQSAREALGNDSAAADLNLIYAAAKIMDPTSVVRESETTMVVQTGSPSERFSGWFNYVAGGGRLTAETRKQLMQEVESRVRGYEAGYKTARRTYEGIADRSGLPKDQIFVDSYAPSVPAGAAPKPAASAAPTAPAAMPRVGDVRNGYVYIGGNPADQSSWTKTR